MSLSGDRGGPSVTRFVQQSPSDCFLATDAATPEIECWAKASLNIAPIHGQYPRGPVANSVVRAMNPDVTTGQQPMPERAVAKRQCLNVTHVAKRKVLRVAAEVKRIRRNRCDGHRGILRLSEINSFEWDGR